jgi:glutamate dehydrogenase
MGITLVDRLSQSTGVSSSDVVRAYVTAREVFDMPKFWQQIETLDYQVDAQVQMELMAELIRLVRRASRWFIRNRRVLIEPTKEIVHFKEAVAKLRVVLPDIISDEAKQNTQEFVQRYVEQGVPEPLALSIASCKELYPFLGIIEAADSIEQPVEKVAEMYFCLSEQLELDWFSKQITDIKIENNWQALARESYRDDLEWQLRTLTVGAMRHICEKGDIKVCIERWMEQQQLLVERWRVMLAELHATETHEFAMYSVAIRELLDLAQSSKHGDVDEIQV